MDLLVLDTIHGGKEIGLALIAKGHRVDLVDVYRGTTGDAFIHTGKSYDRLIVPVHLDPDHPLLMQFRNTPRISHHEAVKWILGENVPSRMIEITGAQGKTTTAHAIAHILPGSGVLHTSGGTYCFPGKERLFRRSITPASLIAVADAARSRPGWLVVEESLGVTCGGELAVITSDSDYLCAGGKKSALAIKLDSVSQARHLLVAPGIRDLRPDTVHAEEIARVEGTYCNYDFNDIAGSFGNPLLELDCYKTPLMVAAAAGCMLGFDPGSLENFSALPGRMALTIEEGRYVIDNANSGSTRETTTEACRYARKISGEVNLLLVIGQEANAVCEGFHPDEILSTIEVVRPIRVVVVGELYRNEYMASSLTRYMEPETIIFAGSLSEGKSIALSSPGKGCVVLAVKSWR